MSSALDAGTHQITFATANGFDTPGPLNITIGVGQTLSANVAYLYLAPQIVTQPQSQTVFVGNPVNFSVTASGSEPLSYQWNKDDVPIAGASESSFRIPAARLDDAGNYSVTVSNIAGSTTTIGAHLTIAKLSQSLSFPPLANKTYGDDSFGLTATANSGLPVVFSVIAGPATLNGSTATITGAGLVMIRASQAGDNLYEPAVDVVESFNVAKKALTVRAGDATRIYGTANPSLDFTLIGFAYNDNASVISGSATLSTTATPTSIVGTYPITAEPGTLSAANYTFTPVNGTLTINKANQTISFAPLIGKAYGDLPFDLAASSDSGLPVSFSVISGPANSIVGTLNITGAGTVTVRAFQPGDGNYNPAPTADQSFTVTKAPLTVAANDTTRSYGEANPTFSAIFAGFVNGDSVSAISGAADFFTIANATSPPGSYVISAQAGTLASQNYSFTFVNGILSITKADQTINFPQLPNKTYGDPPFAVSANSSSGLPVVFSIQSSTATVSGDIVTVTGAGTATIHASQAGDGNYNSAPPVDQSFAVTKAGLTVKAEDATRAYGAENPTFTAAITGFVNGDSVTVVSGVAAFGTTATVTSPSGSYPITPQMGTLSADNYTFSFVNGTLTITNMIDVRIDISLNGNEIRLDWSDSSMQLQEADSIDGPWQSVPGPASHPYTTNPTSPTRYFRLHE